jgi:hypothetical protein
MTAANRTKRSNDTRDSETRKKVWQPPSTLDVPPAPDGFVYRWIRESMNGKMDVQNMTKKLREGYELVKPNEVPGFEAPTIQDGKHEGYVGVGGLILAKFPEEFAEQRDAYYRGMADQQQEAIDNDLMKESNKAMPLDKRNIKRSSETTFGNPVSNDD